MEYVLSETAAAIQSLVTISQIVLQCVLGDTNQACYSWFTFSWEPTRF